MHRSESFIVHRTLRVKADRGANTPDRFSLKSKEYKGYCRHRDALPILIWGIKAGVRRNARTKPVGPCRRHPLAVRQWNGLIAVNCAARAQGVQRHCSPQEARALCPEIKLVHVPTLSLEEDGAREVYHENPDKSTFKASLAPYRRASLSIMQLLQTFSPVLQKASVDEAYLDLTDQVNASILKEVRDSPSPFGTPPLVWEGVCTLASDELPALASTEEYWRQKQLHTGSTLVARIRGTILSQLKPTCSAGIAHNKYLAKIGSAMNKPNQQTTFLECHTESRLKELPISKVPGLGGKLGEQIQTSFGSTVGQLRGHSLEELALALGEETARFLYDFARGKNSEPVTPSQASKSMMAAKSLQPPISKVEQLEGWLRMLSTELLDRLMDQTQPMRWPRTLTITYFAPGQREGQGKSKSGSMPPYFSIQADPTQLWRRALHVCQPVLGSLFPCSRLAVSVGAMEELDGKSKSILSFFQLCSPDHKTSPEGPPKKRTKVVEVSPEPPSTALCPQCNQYIGLAKYPDHLDYHLAKKLQDSFDQEAELFTTNHTKASPPKSRKSRTPPSLKQKAMMQRFFKSN
ncbi:N-acetyltransferase eso1 [Massospora cicadina]|nr:N-acetyltransferase eso1 [Massospora cicadina]